MNASPDLPVLVFDGDCSFCTSSANAARSWLDFDHVEPWQHLDLDALGLTAEQCEQAVQWVSVDGTISSAEMAIISALRHAGGVWRLIGRLLALPGIRQLAGVTYRLTAKNRHRLPGGTPACQLPQGPRS